MHSSPALPFRRHRWVPALSIALSLAAAGSAWAQATATAPAIARSVKVGAGLYELAVGEGTDAVYVASTGGSATIYALDPATLAVKKTIDVSSAPAYGMALNNKTHVLYTTNTRSGSVSAIDTRTGKVLNVISDPSDPRAHLFNLAVDEAADTVYVSVAATPAKIWVIDGKTQRLSGVIENAGSRTTGLTLDPATHTLYAASLGSNEILAIDPAARAIRSRFPSGGERPTHLAFDSKTGRLFITNQGTGGITVVDTKTGALLKTVKTGEGALGLGFNPKTNQIYVANRQAGTVTVVDATTYEVVADLKAGTLPNTVAIDARTNTVYVTNKARGGGRGRGEGNAPAAPAAPDEGGDTVTLIKP
jgi:YVTN family beta-propeller protein